MLNIAFTGGAAIGPALAGAVVAALDVQSALLLDAASFFAIACIVLSAEPLPQAEPEPEVSLRERVRAGLDYARGNSTLRRLLIAEAGALRFLLAGHPDRGDLREAGARG